MSAHLPPWTKVAMPHDDVRDEQAVKAEYAVNLGRIDRGDKNVARGYADPLAFFEATYVTDELRRLLADVMAALSEKKVDRVLQLRTPFGGGKTHSLVALYHLARDRARLATVMNLKGIPDPGQVTVAVLACADLTPAAPRKVESGPTLHTLWGELAFRVGGAEAYELVRRSDESRSAPGGELIEKLLRFDEKKATLLLADEVLVYVEKAMAVPAGDSTLGRQALAFLQHLTEAVAGDPRSAFVYSLQASVAEAVGDEGLLQQLDKLVGRVDARRVPVQDRQVCEVIRRRLFKSLGDERVRREVAQAYADELRRLGMGSAENERERTRVDEEARQFAEEVLTSYPFHPALIRLMYERWGSLPSYQRTRGALQFLGTVVHVLFKRGHGAPLIAPGDVPLDDPDVRSSFFAQVGEREKWDSVLDADVASERARARRVDKRIGEASPALLQARVGSTVAAAVTLYSFGARKDEMRGVVRGELVESCLRPGVEAPTVDAALGDLGDTLLHLHVGGGRYRMDTIPGLPKLIEEAIAAVEADDVQRRIHETFEGIFRGADTAILWPENVGRIPDERREFLIAYLPLGWAESAPEESEARAREMVASRGSGERGGKRRFKNAVALALPQKSQADQARAYARRLLALESLQRRAKANQVQLSEQQKEELNEKHRAVARDLETACRALYAHVLLPVRGKEEGGDPIGFKLVELGTLAATGDSLHGRLLELLKKQVFSDITVDRFVEILGLGAGECPKFLAVTEAIDAFFSFLDHPKMRSDEPLLRALADAVATRKLGYVPEARVEGDRLILDGSVRVRFGSRHDPDEFDREDGAFLVAPSLARELAEEGAPPTEDPGKATVAGGVDVIVPSGSTPLIARPVPKGSTGERYMLGATGRTKQAWYQLAKSINELVMKASAVTVKVEVDARQPSGFDPVQLRNKVKEPLTESDDIEIDRDTLTND